MSTLEELVHLAKRDGRAAEAALLPMLRIFFPDLGIKSCTINSGSKVSLNSVNGFLITASGEELFFKFHAEEGEEKSLQNSEYYNAAHLAKAGWPIITPRAFSTRPGEQCVIYEKLNARTAYDLFGEADALYLKTGSYDNAFNKIILDAEEAYLKAGTAVMLETLQPARPELAEAPLHQLFSHRLFGAGGATPRLDLFYTGKDVLLPDGRRVSFAALSQLQWIINGVAFPHNLAAIIDATKTKLHASFAARQANVLGHGDDHNGNKFLIKNNFVAFDPAFAGRMPALLAPIKATLHNSLLHPFWYYEPEKVQPAMTVSCTIAGDKMIVEENGVEVIASPLRMQVFELHKKWIWQPLIQKLRTGGLLPEDAEGFVRAAAFACPFLALNMIDAGRAPQAQLSVFNLAQCVKIYHNPQLKELVE